MGDIDWGSEDEWYVRDDAGRNPPSGYAHFYDQHDHIHITPLPAEPDPLHVAATIEAWELVRRRVAHRVLQLETDGPGDDNTRAWDHPENVFRDNVENSAEVALGRAGYSDAEWAEHVDGIRNRTFEWYKYESHTEPIEYEERVLTEPRDTAVLWHFFRLNVRRLVRVRRMLYEWYAPHCGNPKRLDMEKECASSMRGIAGA